MFVADCACALVAKAKEAIAIAEFMANRFRILVIFYHLFVVVLEMEVPVFLWVYAMLATPVPARSENCRDDFTHKCVACVLCETSFYPKIMLVT